MSRIILTALAALLLLGGAGCDPLKPGRELMAQGKYEASAKFFLDRTKAHPDDYLAFNELGFAYSRLGMPGPAATAYQQAIKLKPDFFAAYLNLGTLSMKNNEIDAAYYALRKAVELNPESEAAQANLAWTEASNFHNDDAERHLQEAVRLSGDKNKYRDLAAAIAGSRAQWQQIQQSKKRAKQGGTAVGPQAGGTAPAPKPGAGPVPAMTPAEPGSNPKSPN